MFKLFVVGSFMVNEISVTGVKINDWKILDVGIINIREQIVWVANGAVGRHRNNKYI